MITESEGNRSYQFQMIVAVIISLFFAMLLLLSLPLLLMVPEFVCYNSSGQYLSSYECTPNNFCTDPHIKPDVE